MSSARISRLLAAALCLAFVPGLSSSASADGRHPGSVLVFPVHRSGADFATVVSVTNTNTTPASPVSFGGSTSLHYEYVNTSRNGSNPLVPIDCVIFDRYEFLTPGDTLSVFTSCHDAVPASGQSGFLVVSAQDPSAFDLPWGFDHLVGSELVVNASGGMYSIQAIPFRAGDPAPFLPTDHDGDGALDFDGLEYEPIADVLLLDSFLAVAGSHLTLISLTGGPWSRNTLLFEVWNDDEYPLSTTLVMSCWFDHQLTALSVLFEPFFLRQNTPHDPTELDLDCDGLGELETGWLRIDSLGVALVGGTPISDDGALLGCMSVGPTTLLDGGRLLWESAATQTNGVFGIPKLP